MSQQFSTFTDYQQAKQQEKMAKYQAWSADSNRRATLERGVEDENRRLSQAKNYTGELRGGQLESGIYGQSAIDVLRDSMLNMERDRQTMRAGYLQEGQNIGQQANMFRYQAKQYAQKARQILVMGALKTGEQVMTGGMASGGGGGFAKSASGQNIPVSPQGRGVPASQWQAPR
jgi:hypothetical protein